MPKVWISASYRFIPASSRQTVWARDSKIYSRYSTFAESPILGISLEKVGPGLSARARCAVRPDSLGRIATVSTSTPMPPIQWVNDRQNSTPLGRDSISVRIVEPVVVNPLTASKYASARQGIAPENQAGSAPNRDSTAQLSPATAMPSRALRSGRRGLSRYAGSAPQPAVIKMVYTKGSTSFSPKYSATASDGSISAASMSKSRPNNRNTSR